MIPIMKSLKIRPATMADVHDIVDVFLDSLNGLASKYYSAAQIKAWSSAADDIRVFSGRILEGVALIAEVSERIVAFGQLNPENHIDMLCCRTDFARLGIASALLKKMEAISLASRCESITTEASLAGRVFFERHGYVVEKVEFVLRGGVSIERYLMSKDIV
jgi:putative acetyltransferase